MRGTLQDDAGKMPPSRPDTLVRGESRVPGLLLALFADDERLADTASASCEYPVGGERKAEMLFNLAGHLQDAMKIKAVEGTLIPIQITLATRQQACALSDQVGDGFGFDLAQRFISGSV